MAASNDEWELSKENIQPLQRGRKTEILKVALKPSVEDPIQQQRQAFESQLRMYNGDDPLCIWWDYIQWVDQNFPTGGKNGHIHKLIEQCLRLLKEEKKYYNDHRFVEIWLKFANVSSKPVDIFNYMYSNGIGCKSSKFFIAWSWELEQQNNISKADKVISQGIRSLAEPLDKLKIYREELNMRIVSKVKNSIQQPPEEDYNQRSAFTALKPVGKKCAAPISRTGHVVAETNRVPLTSSGRQPQPKSCSSAAKIPFKIYNSENEPSALPVQSSVPIARVLYSDRHNENEKLPSKWNKVKVKQSSNLIQSAEPNLARFQFHCDQEDNSQASVKSVSKLSSILCQREEEKTPLLALFEPEDPTKKSMYPKTKVYCGAKEFSLEELHAAAWFANQNKMNTARKLFKEAEESKKQPVSHTNHKSPSQTSGLSSTKFISYEKEHVHNQSVTETYTGKGSTTYHEAANIIQDMYRAPLSCSAAQDESSYKFPEKFPNRSTNKSLLMHTSHKSAEFVKSDNKEAAVPFAFYCDPTENMKFKPNKNEPEIDVENLENMPPPDYVQDTKKRELNGILEPSKNIPFIPLEDQLEDEEGDDEGDEDVYFKGCNEFVHNETLIPPCNTEQFISSNFLSSTPHANYKPRDTTKLSILQAESIPDKEAKQSLPPGRLSIIMESSRECYKSSSSGSSAGSTKLSDCFSIEKSNIQRHLSKAESLITPKALHPIAEDERKMQRFGTQIQGCMSKAESFVVPKPLPLYRIEEDGHEPDLRCTPAHGLGHKTESFAVPKPLPPVVDEQKFDKRMMPRDIHKTKSLNASSGLGSKHEIAKEMAQLNIEENEISPSDIHTTNINPFDDKLNQELLNTSNALLPYGGKILTSDKSTRVTIENYGGVEIAGSVFILGKEIGRGSFGKVFEASKPFSENFNDHFYGKVALKIERPSSLWEFYICLELHSRLQELNKLPDIQSSIMEVISAKKFKDSMVLVSEFCQDGTLIDLVHLWKEKYTGNYELVIMYITHELLEITLKMHECKIIHGDIKPDNVLLQNCAWNEDALEFFSQKTSILRLIDFGKAIDLKLHPKGICFNFIGTDMCIEMMEDKPWVYQIDWFGVLKCVHVLLFSEHMKVKKNADGTWGIEKKFKRYWDTSVWEPLFHDLLNISSCYQQPDIAMHKGRLERILSNKQKVQTLSSILRRMKTLKN